MCIRSVSCMFILFIFFFFNDTATTEIYTLSLHDALPTYGPQQGPPSGSSIALVRRRSPPPPQPHLGHAAGGAGSRGTLGARNGHTTAPFADECQSFLDNVIAGLGADWIIYSGRDPRRA